LEKEKGDLEQEYINKISALTEEKTKLETSLAEREETIKEINNQKAEVEKDALPKDDLILKLVETIKEKDLQVEELKASLGQEKIAIEKEYKEKLSVLTEEKTKLEAQLIEIRKMLQTRDQEKEELASKLESYSNQISELENKLVERNLTEEKGYEEKVSALTALTEEKTKIENSLKTAQELIVKRDNVIALLTQQKEELEKNILGKDSKVMGLSGSIKEYETKIQELKDQIVKEISEKEKECADKLSLLSEEKNKIEAQLEEAIRKSIPDYYEIKRGDSLWIIAEKYYKNGEGWIRIFEENKDVIKNPSIIYPFQRFTIPKE